MEPDVYAILRTAFAAGVDGDKIRRAFRAGYTVPAIIKCSGWGFDAVYMAIEG